MALKRIFPGVHALALGPVNVFLIEDGPHLTVIDTGYERSDQAILEAARSLGKQARDITNNALPPRSRWRPRGAPACHWRVSLDAPHRCRGCARQYANATLDADAGVA